MFGIFQHIMTSTIAMFYTFILRFRHYIITIKETKYIFLYEVIMINKRHDMLPYSLL